MCTTKTDRQYNQKVTFSKKRFIGNAVVSQLVFAFIFLFTTGMPNIFFGQLPISVNTSTTFADYTIPAGYNAINVTVKGAQGGGSSQPGCSRNGGKGAVVNLASCIE